MELHSEFRRVGWPKFRNTVQNGCWSISLPWTWRRTLQTSVSVNFKLSIYNLEWSVGIRVQVWSHKFVNLTLKVNFFFQSYILSFHHFQCLKSWSFLVCSFVRDGRMYCGRSERMVAVCKNKVSARNPCFRTATYEDDGNPGNHRSAAIDCCPTPEENSKFEKTILSWIFKESSELVKTRTRVKKGQTTKLWCVDKCLLTRQVTSIPGVEKVQRAGT